MFVKIGKYPKRLTCRIHDRYMDKKYGIGWPDSTTFFEVFLEKLEDFIQECYRPINFFLDKRKQKVKVKIHGYDTWGADYTLSHIILPLLVEVREKRIGAPHVESEDVPERLRATDKEWKNSNDLDDNWFARWDYVLDEMIWAFEQRSRDDWESDYFETLPAEERIKKEQMHRERMGNGFRLFGKYYECLWT